MDVIKKILISVLHAKKKSSSIEHIIKLSFSFNDQIIFSMMMISFILLPWICILLTIAIVHEKYFVIDFPYSSLTIQKVFKMLEVVASLH
jgi:hypothetical protein